MVILRSLLDKRCQTTDFFSLGKLDKKLKYFFLCKRNKQGRRTCFHFTISSLEIYVHIFLLLLKDIIRMGRGRGNSKRITCTENLNKYCFFLRDTFCSLFALNWVIYLLCQSMPCFPLRVYFHTSLWIWNPKSRSNPRMIRILVWISNLIVYTYCC